MPAFPLASPRGSRLFSVGALLLFAACIWMMRVHLYTQPFDRDTTNYAVLAHEWAIGRPLYTDLWLHSPPGIVWVYRVTESLVGYGPQEMFALGLTCALITLCAVYAAVTHLGGDRIGGIWAALLWTLFSGSLPLQCSQPNCEAPMITCLAVALALLLYRPEKPWQRVALLGIAGICLALESLIKQITLPLTAAVAVSLIVWPFASISRKRAVFEAGILSAGTVLAWLGLLLQMKLNGAFHAFWQLNVEFNLAYSRGAGSTGMLANIWHLCKPPPPPPTDYDLRWLVGMLVAMTLLIWSRRSTVSTYAKGILATTAAGSLLAVALPGNFFPHYYQLILPNICVATGLFVTIPIATFGLRSLALGVVSFAVFFTNTRHYLLKPDEWTLAEFHNPTDGLCLQMQVDLKTLLKPGETFFEWGDEPQLFFYTNCRPPTGYLFACTILGDKRYQGPWSQQQTDQAIEQLAEAKPALLVLYVAATPTSVNPKLAAWLGRNYPNYVGKPYDAFQVYRR